MTEMHAVCIILIKILYNCIIYYNNSDDLCTFRQYLLCRLYNLLAGDAGWSSWVPGACGAPCGQNGTAVATRICRGPSECCPGEGRRTEVCTSPPCQGR